MKEQDICLGCKVCHCGVLEKDHVSGESFAHGFMPMCDGESDPKHVAAKAPIEQEV